MTRQSYLWHFDRAAENLVAAARYDLTIADVQTAVQSGIGGQNIVENIEGRERYPVNVRCQRDFRDNVEQMSKALIGLAHRTLFVKPSI